MAIPNALPPEWAQAMRVAENEQNVQLDVFSKRKNLFKFGRRIGLGTSEATVWEGDDLHETLPTANDITVVSSSSGSDTTTIVVEGHTISGSELTFVVQSVTLTGQTDATLTTALARCTRMYASGGTNLVGNVYAHEGGATTAGKPNNTAEIHAVIPAGRNQTEKCQTAISNSDMWFITDIEAHMTGSTSARVEMELQVKLVGKVWRPAGARFGLSTTGTIGTQHVYLVPLIVPRNSDVRMVAVATTTSVDVSAGINGFLASIV